jgi:hypothetical protein
VEGMDFHWVLCFLVQFTTFFRGIGCSIIMPKDSKLACIIVADLQLSYGYQRTNFGL